MIQGHAILVVDLGNSSTKGKVLFGKDSKTGFYNERVFDIPNVFAPIGNDYVVSNDYSDTTSTILDVDAKLGSQVIKGHFCNGELQARERSMATIKPTATACKYELASTVLSYRLAMLFACKAIMNMQRIHDYSQLDLSWTVVTLLPPGDYETGVQPITEIVEDIKEVNAVFPSAKIVPKITACHVLPEGYCAYIGVVYDKGRTFRSKYAFLKDEVVIVFDIGAGTTDCLVINENKLVQKSKYTITQGGNNVYVNVRHALQVEEHLNLEESAIRKGIITGYVKDGSKRVDISKYVNKAKADIAQKIISEFQSFLELTDIKLRSVGYVITCGGGSMSDSQCEAIKPISEKIIENVKLLSPNAELVELPMQTITRDDENGEQVTVEEQINPRMLNLVGAAILAEGL